MEEIIKKVEDYIKKKGKQEFHTVDKDELFKVVDIYKDLKEVENMNGYGNEYGRGYGAYNAYALSLLTMPGFFIGAISTALIPEISREYNQVIINSW